MSIETTPCDNAEHRGDAECQKRLIKAAFEKGDPQHIAHALGIMARSRGMTQLSRETGISREALYRTLSKKGNPRLSTLTSILSALGLKISADIATMPQQLN